MREALPQTLRDTNRLVRRARRFAFIRETLLSSICGLAVIAAVMFLAIWFGMDEPVLLP